MADGGGRSVPTRAFTSGGCGRARPISANASSRATAASARSAASTRSRCAAASSASPSAAASSKCAPSASCAAAKAGGKPTTSWPSSKAATRTWKTSARSASPATAPSPPPCACGSAGGVRRPASGYTRRMRRSKVARETREAQIEALRQMTPAERVKIAQSLREPGIALVMAGLKLDRAAALKHIRRVGQFGRRRSRSNES